MKAGDKVWLKVNGAPGAPEVAGEVVKINKKTIRCYSDTRGCEGNYVIRNVRARQA